MQDVCRRTSSLAAWLVHAAVCHANIWTMCVCMCLCIWVCAHTYHRYVVGLSFAFMSVRPPFIVLSDWSNGIAALVSTMHADFRCFSTRTYLNKLQLNLIFLYFTAYTIHTCLFIYLFTFFNMISRSYTYMNYCVNSC